jgi:hypothetical protein
MQASSVVRKEHILNRRQHTLDQPVLWDRLSLSQKFSTSSLFQFGYQLSFIRKAKNNACIAVLSCGDNIATISVEGDIDTSPDIVIR